MNTPKLNWRYRHLEAGLLITIVACMVIALMQPAVRSAAVAVRQRAKLGELERARARWQANTFSRYRLLIQFHLRDRSICEKAFEVHEPAQTNMLSDTCSDNSAVGMGDNLSLGSRTVPSLFDYIEAEIGRLGQCGIDGCACSGATTIDTLYDMELGYPTRIEIRSFQDWTTKGVCLGHSAVATILPSPVTLSVSPIE